jgi:organic hydroperoxide reductase OsmC/OhrA
MKAMYTAEAKATGGRNGHVKSNDVLDLEVRSPKALGANDDYTNPEMLLQQVGLFDNALNLVIKKSKVNSGETSVNAKLA